MTSELTALARQGDPSAIAALMNRTLKPKGITAKAVARQGCLQIQLESAQVPNQTALTQFVSKGLENLQVRSIRSVRLYGYQVGAEIPAWEEEIVLPGSEEPTVLEVEELQNGAMPAATITSSSFESDWQDGTPPPPPRRRSNSWLPLLAIALLAGLGALAYYLLPRLSPQPQPLPTLADSPVAVPTTDPTTDPTTTDPTTDPTTANPTATVTPSQTPFRDAVNRATAAATQTQTAATANEWRQVATLWEEAIALMNQVPQNDANYAIAQEKVSEYQGNLDYAQRKLDEAGG